MGGQQVLLVILGYPNGFSQPRWFDGAPKLHGYPHLAKQHVISFIELISNLNVIHEDITMRIF
jgi:hypothetical protein